MRQPLRYISLAAFACIPLAPGFTSAAQAEPTNKWAVTQDSGDISRSRPRARFPVIFPPQDVAQSVQTGLAPAVHESVHFITSENDAFPLVHGGEIKRPHEVSRFFAPSLIAGKFKPNDFVSTYLRPGSASSASDFLYLLDELNAYTHDLNAAVNSKSRVADEGEAQVDHRDGLAALMAFVALYAERAAESEPATWRGLLEPRVAKTVSELWGRAETVMASSCGIPNFGTEDRSLIRQFCQGGPQAALQKILGRAPVCPTACLKPVPVAARESV